MTGYRVESVACLSRPSSEGHRWFSLGDWFADTPEQALWHLYDRVGEVAACLGAADCQSAAEMWRWLGSQSDAEALVLLQQGHFVRCAVATDEVLYEFIVRPVPVLVLAPQRVTNSG